MSRVHGHNKFVNIARYDSSVTGPSKMVRIHVEGEDYHKAPDLSSWLFMKYDMSYKTYRNKSKNRRNALREEYVMDTGNDLRSKKEREHDRVMKLLAEMGILCPDDEWDDWNDD